jgi:signal transduction histidine kinase
LKELKTMTPHDLHPVEDLKEVDKNIDDETDLSAHQYTHITKKGERVYVEIHTSPLEYEGKEAWISIIRDITSHKLAEAEVKRSHEELKKLAAHLQTVREEERTLVAYELHDDIGQALSALKMDIYMLEEKFLKGEKDLSDRFQKTKNLLDSMIQTIRKIYTELRPTLLEHFSIKEVIEDHVLKFQDLTKIVGKCEIDLGETSLDEDFSLALFRIVQEALNNVKWHSRATEVTVRLVKENGHVVLMIRDNGIGIKENDFNRPASYGIIGMKERASMLGGHLKVHSVPKKGTSVFLQFPL